MFPVQCAALSALDSVALLGCNSRINIEAALAAFREGKHHVLTDYVAKYKGKWLIVNKSITALNLNLNNIGPDGAAAIGKALEVNKTLVEFDIRSNNIGPAGAEAIANMLNENKTLQTLYMGNNAIGDAGTSALGTALKVNNMLTSLDLESNGIVVHSRDMHLYSLLQWA
eukprot:g20367.t1